MHGTSTVLGCYGTLAKFFLFTWEGLFLLMWLFLFLFMARGVFMRVDGLSGCVSLFSEYPSPWPLVIRVFLAFWLVAVSALVVSHLVVLILG